MGRLDEEQGTLGKAVLEQQVGKRRVEDGMNRPDPALIYARPRAGRKKECDGQGGE